MQQESDFSHFRFNPLSFFTCSRSLTPTSATNCSQNQNGYFFSGQHIAELKPGILSVYKGSEVTKYFISSGVVFIHANSFADIVAVEAIPADHIESCLIQKGLAAFTEKLSSAFTDLEKAEAQIGVDVHNHRVASGRTNPFCVKEAQHWGGTQSWRGLEEERKGSLSGSVVPYFFVSSPECNPHHQDFFIDVVNDDFLLWFGFIVE